MRVLLDVATVDQLVAAALEHLAAHKSHCCQQMAAPLYIDLQTQKTKLFTKVLKNPQQALLNLRNLDAVQCYKFR
jgi:hypothetical protein